MSKQTKKTDQNVKPTGQRKPSSKKPQGGNKPGSKKPDQKPGKKIDQSQSGTKPGMDNPADGPQGEGRNDESYWAFHPDLVKSAGTLPFAQALGAPIDWDAAGTIAEGDTSVPAIPGVASIGVGLTYGSAEDESSALNVAARNIYTFIRHMQSGHTNYEAPNLMIYFIAMDNAFALYSFACRVYGTLLRYKVLNRYTPDWLLRAVHVEASDARGNMAQMLFDLQQWGYRLSSFLIPANLKVCRRHYEMFERWYMDTKDEAKAQIYAFYPSLLLKWDEPNAQFIPALDFRQTYHPDNNSWADPQSVTWSQIRSAMTEMINAIATSEDFNIMSGDILKAYGTSGIWSVPGIAAGYTADAVYNWEMLTQIHNMTVCSIPKLANVGSAPAEGNDADFFDKINTALIPKEVLDEDDRVSWLTMNVYEAGPLQTTGGSRQYGFSSAPANMANLLDLPFESPTPDDIMVATRLTVNSGFARDMKNATEGDAISYDMWENHILNYGTEIVTALNVYALLYTHPARGAGYSLNGISSYKFNQRFFTISEATYMGFAFTMFPLAYTLQRDVIENEFGTISDAKVRNVIGDINNHTVLSPITLNNLHTAAIYSVFRIPANATTA